MSIIKITNFGGEIPRVSPRALPADSAQTSKNLLATSTEFRPLLGDSVVGTAVAGAKSLHRLSRGATGVLRLDDTSGWTTETADKNYVKGQINDDATERTYISFNDGSAVPRVIDALGQDRVLGVPPPATLTAAVNQGESFVQEEANAWLDSTLQPALRQAVIGSLEETPIKMHMNTAGTVSVAGPRTLHGLYWIEAGDTDYWNLRYHLPVATATAAGLNDPRLSPTLISAGATLMLRITCLPAWGQVGSVEALKTALRTLTDPVTAAQLFSETLVTDFSAEVVTRFDPAGASIKDARDLLDNTVADFVIAVGNALTPTETEETNPTAPTKPTTAEYDYSSGSAVRTVPWTTYDSELAAYKTALAVYNASTTAVANEKAARIATIAELQARALRIHESIQALYIRSRDAVTDWISNWLQERGFSFGQSSADAANVVKIDPDRIVDTRFYFATQTTDWGEESSPGVLTPMLEVDQYSDVTLTLAVAPSGRNITKRTLYRSNSGSNTTAFQFVAEIPVATLTYTDTKKGAELGEVCPTITWAEPPFRIDAAATLAAAGVLQVKGPNPYLRGMVGMPNGVMAGFIDNFVAFCDPYHPYAWPVEYQIPLKYEVVGLGVFGQSLFVGTYANPSIISGADSGSMSEQILDDAQACLSARSIVSAGGGVLYASPDGICFASLNGVEVITTALFAREDWQKLNPESMVAAMHEGVYYFWYSGTAGTPAGCYAMDMVAKKLTRADMTATAVFSDSLTDAVFYTTGTEIKRAFAGGRRTAIYKTGKMVLPTPAPFAWLQVDGDLSGGTPATVRWYGDGVLRHTATVTSTAPVRLPPGRWLEHEVEIESATRITKVLLTSTTQELQSV